MKKERSKIKMKKKFLVFIGIITLTLSFLLTALKTKALTLYDDYNAMVVYWEDPDTVFITYFDEYNTTTLMLDKAQILDNTETYELLEGYEFEVGIKLKLTLPTPPSSIYLGEIVVEQPDFKIYTLNNMVGGQLYEYKGIYNNKYLFQQGLTFYEVEIGSVEFKNYIDGEYSFTTILKAGNIYIYVPDFGDEFHFVDSYDYRYSIGYQRGREIGDETADRAFSEGYEAGIKYAEGLLESEYQRGFSDGNDEGFTDGFNQGFLEGFNEAYSEIVESTEYELGYNNGFKDGEKSKIVQNNESFYNGIEKWLVPAIITVIILGGIVSITALKRREM